MSSTAMSQHLDPHCGNHEYDLRSIFSFATHYEGNKEPYILVLDPVWVKTDYKLEGTIQFVDYLRAAFNVSGQGSRGHFFRWSISNITVEILTSEFPMHRSIYSCKLNPISSPISGGSNSLYCWQDVWVVTADQMLQWVQTPTKKADLNSFAPFQC